MCYAVVPLLWGYPLTGVATQQRPGIQDVRLHQNLYVNTNTNSVSHFIFECTTFHDWSFCYWNCGYLSFILTNPWIKYLWNKLKQMIARKRHPPHTHNHFHTGVGQIILVTEASFPSISSCSLPGLVSTLHILNLNRLMDHQHSNVIRACNYKSISMDFCSKKIWKPIWFLMMIMQGPDSY